MKILMLNNEYPPLGGGTGTVNQEIINRLKNYPDFKIDLITGCLGKINQTEQLSDNVRIIKLALNNKNIHHATNTELIKYTLKAFLCARKLLKNENYDFSFAWSTIPAGFVSFLLKKFYGLPYLIRVGGPDIPGFEERYKNIYKLITPIIKRIWKNTILLIAKCQTEFDMIAAISPNVPLKIVYNGVDTAKFYPNQNSENELLTIICPARLIKRKGQDILIKAIGKLKQKGILLQLNLVGDGDEKENYKQMVKSLNVADLVYFTDYLPRKQMLDVYQKADLFVLPSYNEGMSNALLEAMACGLPVVVTDVGGTKELVKDGENGFIFKSGEINELIIILEKIARLPHQLKEMGKLSRKKAEELGWDSIVNEYLSIFKCLDIKATNT